MDDHDTTSTDGGKRDRVVKIFGEVVTSIQLSVLFPIPIQHRLGASVFIGYNPQGGTSTNAEPTVESIAREEGLLRRGLIRTESTSGARFHQFVAVPRQG
jgi:hypothetical protein